MAEKKPKMSPEWPKDVTESVPMAASVKQEPTDDCAVEPTDRFVPRVADEDLAKRLARKEQKANDLRSDIKKSADAIESWAEKIAENVNQINSLRKQLAKKEAEERADKQCIRRMVANLKAKAKESKALSQKITVLDGDLVIFEAMYRQQ